MNDNNNDNEDKIMAYLSDIDELLIDEFKTMRAEIWRQNQILLQKGLQPPPKMTISFELSIPLFNR